MMSRSWYLLKANASLYVSFSYFLPGPGPRAPAISVEDWSQFHSKMASLEKKKENGSCRCEWIKLNFQGIDWTTFKSEELKL